MLLRFTKHKSWYYTVSRSKLKMTLRRNIVNDLKLLSRECRWFKVIIRFIVLKSIRSGSLRRVARHAGTHVSKRKSRLALQLRLLKYIPGKSFMPKHPCVPKILPLQRHLQLAKLVEYVLRLLFSILHLTLLKIDTGIAVCRMLLAEHGRARNIWRNRSFSPQHQHRPLITSKAWEGD
jgi:hypothetical protein